MKRYANALASESAAMISIDTHGYAEVAGHHEQIFSGIDTTLDVVRQCGGRLTICAASEAPARVEILLPACAPGTPWLADG